MKYAMTDFRPPRMAMLLLLVAATLHWLTPLKASYIFSSTVVGALLAVAGFGIMMRAWWQFRNGNVAICPTAATSRLITSGIYRFTRNPMYLGVVMMLVAVALYAGTTPFYVAALLFACIIDRSFCSYEEQKLAKAFGDEYLRYKQRVRRWL